MSYIRNTSVQEKWHNGSVTKKKKISDVDITQYRKR